MKPRKNDIDKAKRLISILAWEYGFRPVGGSYRGGINGTNWGEVPDFATQAQMVQYHPAGVLMSPDKRWAAVIMVNDKTVSETTVYFRRGVES